jgi:hypothetical protein
MYDHYYYYLIYLYTFVFMFILNLLYIRKKKTNYLGINQPWASVSLVKTKRRRSFNERLKRTIGYGPEWEITIA